MADSARSLLWTMAESAEVEIETRRDARSAPHRTIIWIVAVKDGIYVRSVKGGRGRWYKEALANPRVRLHVGDRSVTARAEPEKNRKIIDEVSAAYEQKYRERWPTDTDSMVRPEVLSTTLRLSPL